ncbi:hypothetical protein JG688_00001470 [Phytophthora aleatoria]|uniref:Uncharacterized protein n=1 Tax=Phytophthora aleatoria TaxID=2496075 RepID=A0A8J5J6M9_9STRA|nr:hypothetical protein JG688_00001470 [Phytophthora aleatoria]
MRKLRILSPLAAVISWLLLISALLSLYESDLLCLADEVLVSAPSTTFRIDSKTKIKDIFKCSGIHFIGSFNEYYVACELNVPAQGKLTLLEVVDVKLDGSTLSPLPGVHAELTFPLNTSLATVSIRNSQLQASAVEIRAANVSMDEQSAVNVSAHGLKFGPGYNSWTSMGGSYGGIGGASFTQTRRKCEDVPPNDFFRVVGDVSADSANFRGYGSGGGNDESRGGGRIRLVAEENVEINGSLLANGGDACTDCYDSAGAGGSIIVVAKERIHGNATVQANGDINQMLRVLPQPSSAGRRVREAVEVARDIIAFVEAFNEKHAKDGFAVTFGTFSVGGAIAADANDSCFEPFTLENIDTSFALYPQEPFKLAFRVSRLNSPEVPPAKRNKSLDSGSDFPGLSSEENDTVKAETDPRSIDFRYSQIRMEALFAQPERVVFWIMVEYYCVQIRDPTAQDSGCSRTSLWSVLAILPAAIVGSPMLGLIFVTKKSIFYGKLFAVWNVSSIVNQAVAFICGLAFLAYIHDEILLVAVGGVLIKYFEKEVALRCIAQYASERPFRGWRGLHTTRDWYDAAYTPLVHYES